MTTRKLFRYGGVVAVLSGVLSILAATMELIGSSPQTDSYSVVSWVYGLQSLLAIFALFGIYAYQTEESGIWGLLGFILATSGYALLTGGESTINGVELLILGVSGASLGLLLLAVGSLKAGRFPRWVPILWILAPLLGLPGFFIPSLAGILFFLSSIALGLGFIGAGSTLWKSNPELNSVQDFTPTEGNP